jgi:signal transduction histidine kinase
LVFALFAVILSTLWAVVAWGGSAAGTDGGAGWLAPTGLFVTLFGLVLAAVFGGLLASASASPLERLARSALRIQRGELGEVVDGEGGAEFRRLSGAMDRMRLGILERDEQFRLTLAQVAEEIRVPLESLQRLAETAEAAGDPSERAELLERLRVEAGGLQRVVADFMELARPLSARPELHDIRPALEAAAEMIRAEHPGPGPKLALALPAEPLLASVDPRHVRGIALNLLRNAAQAGERIWLTGEVARGEVVITVRDDGPGVDESIRDRVFEAFVTDRDDRAGLGLAIVRRLAEGNGGRVELTPTRDTVGDGAEFRVFFRGADDLPPERPRGD